jgi:hypothetical protein
MTLEQSAQMTESQTTGLLGAYVRRKRFEARLLVSQLSEAMQPKRETGNLASLATLGFGIRGE